MKYDEEPIDVTLRKLGIIFLVVFALMMIYAALKLGWVLTVIF